MKRCHLLILIPVLVVFVWYASARSPVSSNSEMILFAVLKGDGASSVASRLTDAGLIRSEMYFKMLVWRRGTAGDFKPGSFELTASMKPGEIERVLTGGKPVTDERSITILEGWTLNDIAAYFEEEGVMSSDTFRLEAGESAVSSGGTDLNWSEFQIVSKRRQNASLEGYLFPDTYRIYVDAEPRSVIRRMLSNFETKLTDELVSAIKDSSRSIQDIVTMASVIEREVRGAEDMAIVSGIFWKRVDAGIGLEADSTVNYCTGKSLASVTYEDLETDCPWNTYKYRGLPVGPIGNPGISAIVAAINPKSSPYWFFLTDVSGNVHYSATHDEHVAKKFKYLR